MLSISRLRCGSRDSVETHATPGDSAAREDFGSRACNAGTKFPTPHALHAELAHALADESGLLADVTHDRICIQEIIRRHHDSLIKFLRRRLSIADDADDVAQETYIRMMKYEGSREIKAPLAMLFRI